MEGKPLAPGLPPGLIGNPPHEPTDEMRREVRTLAKVCDQEMIAEMMRVSVDTLQRHYRTEWNEGKREAVAAVGGKLLTKALLGHTAEMIFYLKTQGRWSSRTELVGAGGGPIRTFDISRFLEGKTEEELATIERLLVALAASGGLDLPGGPGLGAPPNEGGEAPA